MIRLNLLALTASVCLSTALVIQAQEMEVPISQQFPLLLKILSLDKNLPARVGNEINLGIIYQDKFKISLDVKDNIEQSVRVLNLSKINETTIKYHYIALNDINDLDSTLVKRNINIIYIAPLRAIDLGAITAISRKRQITSITGVASYVEAGVAVGIGAHADKPLILINLSASKTEGANFQSHLLKLARII